MSWEYRNLPFTGKTRVIIIRLLYFVNYPYTCLVIFLPLLAIVTNHIAKDSVAGIADPSRSLSGSTVLAEARSMMLSMLTVIFCSAMSVINKAWQLYYLKYLSICPWGNF